MPARENDEAPRGGASLDIIRFMPALRRGAAAPAGDQNW